MPFRLINAPATFQWLLETCLGELHLQQCIIYLDDIIIFSKTPKEHITRLRAVFERLAEASLKLKLVMREFFKRWVAYLGHIVSKDGVETDPKKIKAIVNWPRASTMTDLCSFLEFTNHYRRFIHKYAHIARPMNSLISGDYANKKKQAIKWNEDCEESFKNYPAYKLEILALKWAVTDQFHDYFYGRNFDLYTDNNPLTHILTSANPDAVGQC